MTNQLKLVWSSESTMQLRNNSNSGKNAKIWGFWPQNSPILPCQEPFLLPIDHKHCRQLVHSVGVEPGPSEQADRMLTTYNNHFCEWNGTLNIKCILKSTKIASSPPLESFQKTIQFQWSGCLLIPILGWGTHSDTFQSLKLDIERLPCQLFWYVQ